MKLSITYKLNGTEVASLEDAIHQILEKDFIRRISHFEKEIIEQGGTVELIMTDTSYKAHVRNVSDDLCARIDESWPSL